MLGKLKKLFESFVISFAIVVLLVSACVVLTWIYSHGLMLTIFPIFLLCVLWTIIYKYFLG
jgi:hypothetical protein